MPRKPTPPCREDGCPRLAVPGERYCAEHLKKRTSEECRLYNQNKRDQEAQAFYNSAQWRKVRAAHIKAEPLCRICASEGRITPAELVDHIRPIKQGGAKLDESNLQSLCNACHERKSREEGSRGGFTG